MMTDGSVIKRKELNPKRRTSEGKGGGQKGQIEKRSRKKRGRGQRGDRERTKEQKKGSSPKQTKEKP